MLRIALYGDICHLSQRRIHISFIAGFLYLANPYAKLLSMKLKLRANMLCLLVFLIVSIPAFSDDGFVTLEKITYNVIDGNTKERALRQKSYMEDGQVFESLEEMILALDREQQDLTNTRYFKSISYTVDEVSPDVYTASFSIEDAFTVVPIIYPKYDSNTGFRLGMQIYWNNFFGTMTNAYLGMNMDIRPKLDGGSEIGEWSISPSLSGIRLTDDITMSTGMSQRFVEEEFIDSVEPQNSYDYSFHQTSFSAGTRLELRRYLGYSLSVGMDFRYLYDGDLGPISEQPYAVTLSHGIGWGKVDWLENRRKGYSMSLSNPHRIGTGNDFFYITSVNYSATAYAPFWKRFYYYPRLYGFYQYGETSTFGSMLRGVADNIVSGVTGVVLNNSLAFQFWRFENVWDAQIHPFLDMGLAYNGTSFDADRDFNVGAGIDLVLYLDKIPNLVARGTVGFDVRRFSTDNITEHMEIIISSSLFY